MTSDLCVFIEKIFVSVHQQTVKRPRKVPVNLLNRPPSPDDRVFNNDYNDDYNYEQDRRSVYSGRSGVGRDHSLERERGGGGYMDSGYQTRERDHDRDYDRRERGRSTERDLSPDRQYRRDGSRGRTLDGERSPDRPYRSDHMLARDYSPDRRYRSERALDRDHSPDRRYRSERALDRDYSPDRRYRSERTLDRTNSPDLRRRRDSHSPARGHGRDPSFERGRERIPSDPRKYDEPLKRSGSRDRLDRSPSPAAMPIPLPRPARDLEPLEKPLNVLLLKNRPNEGEKQTLLCQIRHSMPAVWACGKLFPHLTTTKLYSTATILKYAGNTSKSTKLTVVTNANEGVVGKILSYVKWGFWAKIFSRIFRVWKCGHSV